MTDRLAVTNQALRELSGVNGLLVGDWMKAHEDEVICYKAFPQLNTRVLIVLGCITDTQARTLWYRALTNNLQSDIYLENGEWGVGSGEEGFSFFVVRETHGSLAPFPITIRWALHTNDRISFSLLWQAVPTLLARQA
jgi:hypothetical protein